MRFKGFLSHTFVSTVLLSSLTPLPSFADATFILDPMKWQFITTRPPVCPGVCPPNYSYLTYSYGQSNLEVDAFFNLGVRAPAPPIFSPAGVSMYFPADSGVGFLTQSVFGFGGGQSVTIDATSTTGLQCATQVTSDENALPSAYFPVPYPPCTFDFPPSTGLINQLLCTNSSKVDMILNVTQIKYHTATLDLWVSMPEVSQPGSKTDQSGNLIVDSSQLVTISVPVYVKNIMYPETRSTTLELKVGSQTLSQPVQVNGIPLDGKLPVSFTVNFGAQDVGLQDIIATINPENGLKEADFTNNISSTQVRIGNTVKLVKTVTKEDGTRQNPDQFAMIPSVEVFGASCSSKANHSEIRTITLKCVDAKTDKVLDGCNVAFKLKPGNYTGGHDPLTHGERPLYESLTSSIDDSDIPLGSPVPIPTSGLSVDYESPQPAGEIIMSFDLQYPEGFVIPATDTYIEVQAAENYVSLKSADTNLMTSGLEFVNFNSHPTDGWYGTFDMMLTVSDLINKYQNIATSKLGIINPAPLNSEAASLSLGGVFDIKHTWIDPHCGHRDGRTIDVSVSNLQNDPRQLDALEAAFEKLHLDWTLESNPPHYHVQE